jgi:hypothetical protein
VTSKFQPPEKIRRELEERKLLTDPVDVEWRPGSGQVARYEPEDRLLSRRIYKQGASREIEPQVALNQLDVIHELKLLGAKLLSDEELAQLEHGEAAQVELDVAS